MSKSLVKNSIYNVIYKLLSVLFPLITATYVSRVLMADGVGKVSYAQNIVSYFTILAALGMPAYGTREIAKMRGKNKDIVFSELFFINAISTLFFSVAYFILIFNVEMFSKQYELFCICGIVLVLNIFNIDWYYQGEEEYRYITIRSFIVKCICVAAIFIFVKEFSDFWIYALITALGIAGNYILNVINVCGKVHLKFTGIHLLKHLIPLLVLLSSAIAVVLYTSIDVTMIGIMMTEKEVGYYSNAIKLVNIVQTIISAIGAILIPRLSYLYSVGNKTEFCNLVNKALKTMVILALPAAIGLFFVSDTLVLVLFGNAFRESIGTLKILALTLPILVINVLLGGQVLIPTNKERRYFITVCIGAVVNLCLNPFFIKSYGQNGAAFASLISEGSVGLLTYLFVRKIINIKLDKKFLFTIVGANIAMSVVLVLINNLKMSHIITLILDVILGCGTYFLTLVVFRNDIIIEMMYKGVNKLRRFKIGCRKQ